MSKAYLCHVPHVSVILLTLLMLNAIMTYEAVISA